MTASIAADMRRASVRDHQLGAAGGERRGGGGAACRRVAAREVVHAADAEARVQQRGAEAAADEAEPAGHEHVGRLRTS